MKKKLMMILLSAAMIVSMLPATAFAGTKFVVKGTGGEKSVALAWNKVAKAKTYKVYMAKKGAKAKLVKKTSSTKFTKKSLKANTSYKAYIVACKKNGKKIAKTKTIYVKTLGAGNAITFQDTSETPRVLFEGKIPYETWAKAVAAGWSFDAKVGDKTVKSKLIEYSDNRVGVEAADGQKFGVFYNATATRYAYEMVKLEDRVDAGHAYTIGEVVANNPLPITELDNLFFGAINVVLPYLISANVPYATWSEAAQNQCSASLAISMSDVDAFINAQNEDKKKELQGYLNAVKGETYDVPLTGGGTVAVGVDNVQSVSVTLALKQQGTGGKVWVRVSDFTIALKNGNTITKSQVDLLQVIDDASKKEISDGDKAKLSQLRAQISSGKEEYMYLVDNNGSTAEDIIVTPGDEKHNTIIVGGNYLLKS